jgi:hypothetical protein
MTIGVVSQKNTGNVCAANSQAYDFSARNWVRFAKAFAHKTSVRMNATLVDLKVSVSAASFPTGRIGFVSQKNGTSRSYRFCFGGLRRRTPGPPPFSSMNSMPAASKVRRIA